MRHFGSLTSLALLFVLVLAGCASKGAYRREGSEKMANLDIGLKYDDTIFTTSARTRDFSGQALIPRLTYFESSKVYDGAISPKLLSRQLRPPSTKPPAKPLRWG